MIMRRKLVGCCARDMREISLDFDEQERIMTYNGLERCILNSQSFDNDSGTSRGGVTDSYDDDEDDSTCSSSNNASGSFSSLWTVMKKDDDPCQEEWSFATTRKCEKSSAAVVDCSGRFSDVEMMKEKFSKLLLGDDVTGGVKGTSTALALSNAITGLAATIFGEIWKLEPLPEEIKCRWRTEMDWLLSPTNYMVELVPAKQHDTNGRILEIMTPKTRSDIHVNLPALRKLDSMLIETLDSMVGTEFWYTELGSRAEGRSQSGGQSRRWWLPSPRVPNVGLSDVERKRLLHQGKLVNQVFKAARSINENVLAEMSVPITIKGALPKSGRVCLGEELYKILTVEFESAEDMINCLNLKSEHGTLDVINRLEAAVHAWKGKISEQGDDIKSPARTPWRFVRDPMFDLDKTELLVNKAEVFRQQIKAKHPNLPQTFLDVTKIQYSKDIGHAILEAYSRVLANLAFSILSRIGDILQEDVTSNPNSPLAMSRLVGTRIPGVSDSPMLDSVRHSLIHQLNVADGKSCNPQDISTSNAVTGSTGTPGRSRVWCVGREACRSLPSQNSP